MFKLIKIQNSPCSAPEPVIMPKGSSAAINAGDALSLASGLVVATPDESIPSYIALSDAKTGATSIPCIRISQDMLFETALPSEGSFYIGERVLYDSETGAIAKSQDGTGSIEIVEINDNIAAVAFVD